MTLRLRVLRQHRPTDTGFPVQALGGGRGMFTPGAVTASPEAHAFPPRQGGLMTPTADSWLSYGQVAPGLRRPR
jgi:hypothetical protein